MCYVCILYNCPPMQGLCLFFILVYLEVLCGPHEELLLLQCLGPGGVEEGGGQEAR